MDSNKIVIIAGGVLAVAGLLDLKCKGAFYKILPTNVQHQVDRVMQNK